MEDLANHLSLSTWKIILNTFHEAIIPDQRIRNGYPSFMQTKAWYDKELTTALASWTELRHDTILYAKQGYDPVGFGFPPPIIGYIEPVPEFYNHLLVLTRIVCFSK